MSTASYAVSDTFTMLRRDFKHTLRYPLMTFATVLMPIIMLLLFVYVFGGAIGAGIGGDLGGTYLNYIVPGILVMAVGAGCGSTAVNVSADMHEGIITRFRTMAISRASVLTGQVVGAVIRILISMTLVIATALLLGFRPSATFTEWIAVIGVLALFTLTLTWLSVAFGLLAKTPGGANSSTMPLQFLLPFISSAFASPESMPSGLRWFVENQPFTHVMDTLRGLLLGSPIGNSAVLAVVWCVGLTLAGYLWAKSLYNRDPSR